MACWSVTAPHYKFLLSLTSARYHVEIKHLLSRMLVTNPNARATLPEVLSHPWMVRNPPDPHLLHREPLRADEVERDVMRGMTGFEIGTEDEIENRLVDILKSKNYPRAVEVWERK